ncbi:hypothetical protein TKK_0018090 [Trichogramma kaykai]|uniref:Odorant receptor n=1 Tax=Trichogramma kaykai TaxID=54128 RepID=A0ABD2VZS4_9HYME
MINANLEQELMNSLMTDPRVAVNLSKKEIRDIVNKFMEENYCWVKTTLQMAFLWPYDSAKRKYAGRFFILFNIVHAFLSNTWTVTHKTFRKPIDFEFLIANLFEWMVVLVVLMAYTLMISKSQDMQIFFKLSTLDMVNIIEPDERIELDKCIRRQYNLSRIFGVLIAVSFVGFAIMPGLFPVIGELLIPYLDGNFTFKKTLCTTADLILDRDDYFYFWYFYTWVYMAVQATVVISIAMSFLYIVSYTEGKFNIVGLGLYKLYEFTSADNFVNNKKVDDKIHEMMREVHINHFRCIEYCNHVNRISRSLLFILWSLILASLSFTGSMSVILIHSNLIVFLEMSVSFGCAVSLGFFISYSGQIVTDASGSLYEKAYNCGWYHFPKRSIVYVQLMLVRCIRPCELNAGPSVIRLNYESFSIIMNTAMSYITVMVSLV